MTEGLRKKKKTKIFESQNTERTHYFSLLCQCHEKKRLIINQIKNLPNRFASGVGAGKGGITVEAALALPLFLFAISVFFSFFAAQFWQLKLQKNLDSIAEDIAVWSYALDFADDYSGSNLLTLVEGGSISRALSGSGADLESLLRGEKDLIREMEQFLLEKGSALVWQPLIREWLVNRVGREAVNASLIQNGAGGLSLSGSTLHKRNLDLVLSYRWIPLFGDLFGVSTPIVQRSCRRLWIGTPVAKEKEEKEEEQEEEEEEEALVFVTENGIAYHRNQECRVFQIHPISTSLSAIGSLRNENGGKYYPCERCVLGKPVSETVCYTDFGVRYHNVFDCPGLKRVLIRLALSEAKEKYKPCGFCGGDP